MVELVVLSTAGLPERSLLSVRSGSTRRQQTLPPKAPFALPGPPGPYRIDVFAQTAWSHTTEGLPKLDGNKSFRLALNSGDGRPRSLTFKVAPAAKDKPLRTSTEVVPMDELRLKVKNRLMSAFVVDLDGAFGGTAQPVEQLLHQKVTGRLESAHADGTLTDTLAQVESNFMLAASRDSSVDQLQQVKDRLESANGDGTLGQILARAENFNPGLAQVKDRLESAHGDGTLGHILAQAEHRDDLNISRDILGPGRRLRGDALKAQIDEYLAKHELTDFMRGLFAQILRDRPTDPYTFFADEIARAAKQEDELLNEC